MSNPHPTEFANVTAVCKANIYFDGGVISHSLHFADGSRKTLGIIRPGNYRFDTQGAEIMQIIDGACRVRHGESQTWTAYPAGSQFDVPAKSHFEITVDEGMAQYICSFV